MFHTKTNRTLYPMIEHLMDDAIAEVNAGRSQISCQKGCGYCCYLLVEISWDEALELAKWINRQSSAKRKEWENKIKKHAARVRKFFKDHKIGKRFIDPSGEHDEMPDDLFVDYADELNMSCPFLEKGKCAAYDRRPTPCRLHVVSSPAEFCSHCHENDEEDIKVPRKIISVQKAVGQVMEKLYKDQLWGQLSIMVEAALKSI